MAIRIRVEPQGEVLEFPSLNTVLQLLNKLGLTATQALVIRQDSLLTPDRKLAQGDEIVVRKVISAG